jgi:tight adherence protein C
MNTPVVLACTAAGALTLAGSAMLMLQQVNRRARLAERIRFARGIAANSPKPLNGRSPVQLMAELGTAVAESGFLPSRTLAELEQTLASAGFRGANGLSLFVGSKLTGLVLFPLLAWFLLPQWWLGASLHHILAAASGIVGLLLPDFTVRRLRARYVANVERGLPDALDMLVICAEAGLGLVSAITRVGTEIRAAHPAVADELLMTADELHVIAEPRTALANMGIRTGLSSLKRLSATLIQSQHYGTPLAHALRALSSEMRQEALIRFEERAARLPALLTVLMILFILPAVFLVVGGPAMIQVLRVMRH